MAKIKHVLNAQARIPGGTGAARRLRGTGLIPAVVYGKGTETRCISVSAVEWGLLSRHALNIVSLVQDGNETLVLLKEVQHNAIKNCVSHIDFQEINKDQKIIAKVPVYPGHNLPVGESAGGMTEQMLHEIEVEALPQDMPESLTVDISALNVGEELRVGEIAMPDGVTAVSDHSLVVFAVVNANSSEEEASASDEEGATEPEVIAEKKTEERREAKKAAE